MLTKAKNRKVAAILALVGAVIPVAGFHKFYMGQPVWGLAYLLLSWGTPIPRIASAIEGFWYLVQDGDEFDRNFNLGVEPAASSVGVDPDRVGAIADALRQLDSLREEGLISEYEFEQKRRQWLDRIA
ncbi:MULTISPECIES: NINE protein [unclassified Coleofasciculus]|uniref:NINE protein n=1 Tax=Cyanophyceae TaxID=3028117 RepID=UPI001689926E|nr:MULTISPECIES: NINE protein [unclassified Coleofasciculus]MBD1893523.1 NINE protein [Coleofasciculus sp. FACHB-129]MBD2085786.1 NINE protein [Coleofasciculus sp. FACHB-542]MBD2539859.1 NINE protein [Coleofasciculus sp. FACHB-SPT36]MBD2741264.1 NINE protein [Coleofasciculus sp. FACHB-1120]